MLRIKSVWVWFIVIIIYLVGLLGFIIPAWHDVFVWLIPFNIIFAFIVLLLGEVKLTLSKLVLFLICFLFGYTIEFVGTKTGVIFGEYTYGDGLGLKILDVPLLIGLNWFFMVYTSLAVTSKISKSPWVQTLLAPVFMVVYDYFLEPFAMKNEMWFWSGNEIPLQNYIAWYFGGLFLCAVAVWGKFELKNRFAAGLFVVQVLFFVLLFLWDKF